MSAAKYARAERELKATRPLGEGTKKFYECAEVGSDATADAHKLYVAITSDRGKILKVFVFSIRKLMVTN